MPRRPPAATRPSLEDLRERYLVEERPLSAAEATALAGDPRAGAQALLRAIEARRRRNRAEGQRLRHLLRFEGELYSAGHQHIAGVDEAGMAPLAGPVVAGAAILPPEARIRGLDDSKKILDEETRDALAAEVKAVAVAWAVGQASVEEIDSINIYHAGLLAMRRAVLALPVRPDFVLVDARSIPDIDMPQRGIIKGDALSLSIAAGAILAKTTRDAMMRDLHVQHPQYGFAAHKGYPTPEHVAALRRHGPLPCHRVSFAPVRLARVSQGGRA